MGKKREAGKVGKHLFFHIGWSVPPAHEIKEEQRHAADTWGMGGVLQSLQGRGKSREQQEKSGVGVAYWV